MGRKATKPVLKKAEPEAPKVQPVVEPEKPKVMVAGGVEVQILSKKEAPKDNGWVKATPEEVLVAEKAGTLVGYDPVKGLAKFK